MNIEAIALVVDEPIAGHFYWVLQKQDGSDCRPVDAAEGPMPTYGAAMMAGIAALQRRTESRAQGEQGDHREHGDDCGGVPVVRAFMNPHEDLGPPTIH